MKSCSFTEQRRHHTAIVLPEEKGHERGNAFRSEVRMPLYGIISICLFCYALGWLTGYALGKWQGRKLGRNDREPEILTLKMDIIHTEQGIQKSGQESG